ncbi:cob(I)yrinic acid a,c-diamide adenosyltransferase [Glycomyces sp. TRM65418]|uniref:cob(I)yrinic acid a,c-diamide adenosyltransferase n=1 Tax=Glycomyces sp. TRM65418 TaxID=2867006 RepID=UPI001CE4D0D3|nr:cob(I)yrinic acid a,c-diamide adenosyltransferase [Glycomyces sp. TRM65418]MCC3764549.1 cob(I)yrinic acid a,c-diamide adenosyltransferase [Glycomyces sp. TRM65418]QZD54216.1 cob(I)yrinic acid a,c-diamide adenosyltransferase [Glycomyces sp. TRM65418]
MTDERSRYDGATDKDTADAQPKRRKRETPLLMVHTGTGKGKSTAAFGMMMRAWNQDWPIAVFQFVKSGKWRVGEQAAAAKLGGIDWFKMGDGWSWTSRDLAESADLAREGWEEVKRCLAEERYRFYLLDEFTYPMKWGWVDTAEVVETLERRTGLQYVMITGRDAPAELVEAADLVTEMTKVKHPLDQGWRGQKGIEW